MKGLLAPGNMAPWEEVRDELNRKLLGWSTYFSYGTYRPAERGLGYYVYERVRDFLVRRYKVSEGAAYIGSPMSACMARWA